MGWEIYVAIGVFVLSVVVAVVIAVVLSKKKSKSNADEFKVVEEARNPSGDELNRTVIMSARNDDGCTRMLWAEPTVQHTLYLTDVYNPARTFQMALNNRIVIGRKPGEADLVIGYENSISGRHCMISERVGRFYIKDLQSLNGTMLNGARLVSEMEVYSGSIVTLGKLEMKLEIR